MPRSTGPSWGHMRGASCAVDGAVMGAMRGASCAVDGAVKGAMTGPSCWGGRAPHAPWAAAFVERRPAPPTLRTEARLSVDPGALGRRPCASPSLFEHRDLLPMAEEDEDDDDLAEPMPGASTTWPSKATTRPPPEPRPARILRTASSRGRRRSDIAAAAIRGIVPAQEVNNLAAEAVIRAYQARQAAARRGRHPCVAPPPSPAAAWRASGSRSGARRARSTRAPHAFAQEAGGRLHRPSRRDPRGAGREPLRPGRPGVTRTSSSSIRYMDTIVAPHDRPILEVLRKQARTGMDVRPARGRARRVGAAAAAQDQALASRSSTRRACSGGTASSSGSSGAHVHRHRGRRGVLAALLLLPPPQAEGRGVARSRDEAVSPRRPHRPSRRSSPTSRG